MKIDVLNYPNREFFYKKVISTWLNDKDRSVLVVGGGKRDRDVFFQLNFMNVTITNNDERIQPELVAPYIWQFQDLEQLNYPDQSFDYVIAHNVLHHLPSPHKGLLEMYRVAKLGLIAVEPYDNMSTRLAQVLGLAQIYEHGTVQFEEVGVANTDIPNHVYRFTEAELEKVIRSNSPIAYHEFDYLYGRDEPGFTKLERNGWKFLLMKLIKPLYFLFTLIFPKQQNLFAFMVNKPNLPKDLLPWLSMGGDGIVRFNGEWGRKKYIPKV
jgi:SAM-dependent methyltransferase